MRVAAFNMEKNVNNSDYIYQMGFVNFTKKGVLLILIMIIITLTPHRQRKFHLLKNQAFVRT